MTNALRPLEHCQQLLHAIRIETNAVRKFIPEKEIHRVLSRDLVRSIISAYVPYYHSNEVLDFVLQDALKVFGILALMSHPECIGRFIQNDQLQTRSVDSLLPFTKAKLQAILGEYYLADLFFERQWELCTPVFSGRMIPRVFDRETILPFLREWPLAAGSYGEVFKIEIHPSHRPSSPGGMKFFVRKELDLNDSTYENESSILAALQRLNHPNILQLVGCYSLGSKNNLISPYISGGTLRKFLQQEKPSYLSQEEGIYAMSGLASAVWALHGFMLDTTGQSYKGHHQDLRHDNILIDGQKFVLADFGLSSIKELEEKTSTPFKGRKGYCQAPECVQLVQPFREHGTTRATDIFALACVLADIMIYLVDGPKGVQEFKKARQFKMPPMCYYLYHKGDRSNEAVASIIQQTAQKNGSQSMHDLANLIGTMLDIDPHKRPTAAVLTAKLYIMTTDAFAARLSTLFDCFKPAIDAYVEKARFLSWVWTQDYSHYCRSSGATTASKNFDTVVGIFRQLLTELEKLSKELSSLDNRSFLEVRTLNTQLLNMLSPEHRSNSQSRLQSMLLAKLDSETKDLGRPAISISGSEIARKAETKQLLAQAENNANPPLRPSFRLVTEALVPLRKLGIFRILRLRHTSQKQLLIAETVHYQDPIRRQRLLPRIHALCELLSNEPLSRGLQLPPFFGMRENTNDFCFEVLYELPKGTSEDRAEANLTSLHELLAVRDALNFPSWENRCSLSREIAESLASFHDIDWYHKDFTSFCILSFSNHGNSYASQRSFYLLGFHHSRSAVDDFTEGPLQDRNHQRYHHPQYISAEDRQFTRFCPQFDYYSLGIVLMEIGLWGTIEAIMEEHLHLSNHEFAATLVKYKLPLLAFHMGSWYANIVCECLNGIPDLSVMIDRNNEDAKSPNVRFKEKVVIPLKEHCATYVILEPKRKSVE